MTLNSVILAPTFTPVQLKCVLHGTELNESQAWKDPQWSLCHLTEFSFSIPCSALQPLPPLISTWHSSYFFLPSPHGMSDLHVALSTQWQIGNTWAPVSMSSRACGLPKMYLFPPPPKVHGRGPGSASVVIWTSCFDFQSPSQNPGRFFSHF